MKVIDSFPQLFRGPQFEFDFLKSAIPLITEWAGRTFEWLRNVSQQMREHQHIAYAIFSIANLVFFSLMNLCGNHLEKRVNSSPQKLCKVDRIFNHILIDGFVVGGAMLSFNILLFTMTDYSVKTSILAAITIMAIALRTFFHLK